MANRRRIVSGSRRAAAAAVAVGVVLVVAGCRTSLPQIAAADLELARAELTREVRGNPAALYRLRVSASGGLRLSLLTSGSEGRLTISEPFGSAVSVTAWRDLEPPAFFDLREGCKLDSADLSQILGIGAMPLPEAVRLLVGRLPSVDGDRVATTEDSVLWVDGTGWSARVVVAADPWRVVSVVEAGAGGPGWRIDLGDHIGSIPGSLRLKRSDGRWAELELVSLEWNDAIELPDLPELPPCAEVFRE
jgi:hypothetical protein